jgi:hypothetical protein
MNEILGRDEFTHDCQGCLSFISNASTVTFGTYILGSLELLFVDPHDMTK